MNTATHTIQPEDLFRFKFLHDAWLSPNGATVAYVIVHVDPETDKDCSTIWLLSLESGETRQLTAGMAYDTNPRWSPDGKQIAFLRRRASKPQIYLIAVDGGEAHALTSMSQGVGGAPAWSPDGETIAFSAGPIEQALDLSKPYRITRHLYRFDGVGYLDNTVQDIYTISSQGEEPRQLTDGDCHNGNPVWSPDGREILFSVSGFPDTYRLHPALHVVNLDGDVRELVGDWGDVGFAAWTPDGERVLFLGKPSGVPIGTQSNLWAIDSQGGSPEGAPERTPECRTAGLAFRVGGGLQPDMPVFSAMRSPRILVTEDSQNAFVQVQVGGKVQIYRIAISGPESCSPVIAGERSCIPQALNGSQLLYLVSTMHNPTDLYVADVDGSNERRLTHLNAELLSGFKLPTVQGLSFPGVDGVQVEGWIMKPSDGQAPYPTILYIHGGPYSAFGHAFCFDFQMLAGGGYAVLFINYRSSTGYGDAFANQAIGDFGNLDYKDLMAGVDYAIAQGLADPDRLGCCGISAGGQLACWIVGQTDRFKAAVPENPVTNWVTLYGVSDNGPALVPLEMGGLPHEVPEVYRRCSPITYAHRCTTPTLLIQGEADRRCPPEQSEQFYAALKANGCVVEMLRLPNSPHGGSIHGPPIMRRAQNEALLDWMNRYVLEL